jgi:hypothetical protein
MTAANVRGTSSNISTKCFKRMGGEGNLFQTRLKVTETMSSMEHIRLLGYACRIADVIIRKCNQK